MPTELLRRAPQRVSLALPMAGLVLAATALTASAQSPSTVPTGSVSHPTGALDIVLSMETGGGFVPFGYFITQAPTFVLYGDNTVIFRPSEAPEGQDLAPFVKATLSPAQVDALLTYALSVGRLADAAESYQDMTVSDAPTTVFTVDAAGIDKSVSVYALGIGQPSGRDAEMYAAFNDLGTLLSTFEQQVAKGNVISAETYQPETYRVVLSPADLTAQRIIDWPWPDLSVNDFAPMADNPSFLLAGLTPEQLSAITTVPSGGGLGVPVRSPDGSTAYLVQWRPLLPGETVQPAARG
ncbi:MAG: hypothetical protein U0869_14770 [Chloroflexota bacterium]